MRQVLFYVSPLIHRDVRSHRSDKQHAKQTRLTGKWHGGWPLKYLSDDQEAEGDGDGRPEVRGFREDLSIVVLQVSPAQPLGKPDPVCPYHLIQPRQHPGGETDKHSSRRLRSVISDCVRKWRIAIKEGFVCTVVFVQIFPLDKLRQLAQLWRYPEEEEWLLIGADKSHPSVLGTSCACWKLWWGTCYATHFYWNIFCSVISYSDHDQYIQTYTGWQMAQ